MHLIVLIALLGLVGSRAEVWEATLSRPFIFFHVEKTGGTDLRVLFYNMLKEQKKNEDIKRAMIPTMTLPAAFTDEELIQPMYLNRTACATMFLGHFRFTRTLATLWAVDQGLYGPVACHRGWPRWEGMRERERHLPWNIPLLNLADFHLILPQIQCTTVLREPIGQHWSHYYFFDYKKIGKQFVDIVGDPDLAKRHIMYTKDLTLLHMYWGMESGVAAGDQLGVPKALLQHCHSGIEEAYVYFYKVLKTHFPALPSALNLPHSKFTSTSDKSDVPLPETLPDALRLQLAKGMTQDGRLWAFVRDLQGADAHRDGPHRCDLVCWAVDGTFWLPQHNATSCTPCAAGR